MTIRLWIARHLAPIKVATTDIPITIPAPSTVKLAISPDR